MAWLLVVAAAFLIVRALPGDPAEILIHSNTVAASKDLIAEYHAAWGLDRSLPRQFFSWLGSYLTGDWGQSMVTGRPILSEFASRAPWSFAIGTGGLALATIGGFFLGFRAALRPAGIADHLSRALAVGSQSLPAFAVGLVMFWLLAVELKLVAPLSGSIGERLVMPMLLVALFSIGSAARVSRAAFREARQAPWMRTARAKGLSEATALWRHAGRHSGLTLLAAVTPELAWVIGGTTVAEVVFGVPGLSEAVVDAVLGRDYMVLQAYIAFVALWILLINEAARTARLALDPRLA